MPNNKSSAQFITVEGIEGVGKTTALAVMKEVFAQAHLKTVFTREPGGTPIAEAIRRLVLDANTESISHETELLLIFAARAQHITHVIKPALAKGLWVVSDRFTDASYAYQGGGRGIAAEKIAVIENWVQDTFRPNLTLLLDAPVSVAMTRAKQRTALDRIEAEEIAFFERARATYLARAAKEPKRFCVINADQPLAAVAAEINTHLQAFIDKMV